MTSSKDIVIIGGGVHGCSLAFHLARRQAGQIVLLEKNWLASGPTAKSGALIRPLFSESEYVQLVLASTSMFERWNEIVGGDAGFVQNGFLRITHSLDPAELGANLEQLKRWGVPVEVLTADQLRQRVPSAEFNGTEIGVFFPKAGFADPFRTTLSLARAAQGLGVEIREGVSVMEIESKNGAWTVQTGAGPIAARRVVNCAGPWSREIAALVGITLPIEVNRVPTFIFRRPETMPISDPILSDGVNRVYLRSLDNNLFRAGHFGSEPEVADPDGWDETVNQQQLAVMRAALNRRCDPMRRTASLGGFSALYDMTPDGHPIISHFPQAEGFWCNCGWSGNGFASAPAAGRALAQLMLDGKSEIDLSLFEWPRRPGIRGRSW